MRIELKGALIGAIIGLLGFTSLLKILLTILFPIFFPLVIFTESVLGIELEGICQSIWCNIPYGFFTTIYLGFIGLILGFIISKLLKLKKNEK